MPKKALIIGASSGIGKALAIVLAKKGYTVGITGRRTTHLNETAALYPEQIIPYPSDATHLDRNNQLDDMVNQLGGLDLFVISAGIGHLNISLDYSLEDATNQLNVIAFTKLTNWCMHFFEQQGQGHFVNISSVASRRGGGYAPAYNASKAYQSNYLEGLRQRYFKQKINVVITDIRPGFVDTAMAQGDGLFWVATKEKAANQIYSAIRKKKAVAYITKRWALIAFLFSHLPIGLHKRI